MGRHSDTPGAAPRAEPARPAVSSTAVAVWGPFATLVASTAALVEGAGWSAVAVVAGLGAGGTALLWAAVRRAAPPSRPPGQPRRVQ